MLLLGQIRLFPLALAATALLGFLDSMGATIRVTIVQLETPNAIRGRVASLQGMLARGGPALGQTLAGALAVLFGVPGALVVGATVPLFLTVGLACFGRSLRGYRPSL
jgi:hypothetical protein